MRTHGSSFLTLGILAALFGAAASAAGAPARPAAEPARPATSTEPAGDQKEQAKKLFLEGSKLYQAGRFDEAIGIFEKAYALWANPKILVNIAICHVEAGRPRKAVLALRKALTTSPQDKVEGIKAALPERLKKANQEAAELSVKMPEEAEVEIGGVPEGKTPATILLMPGAHEVVVKVGGQEKVRKTVTLTAGGQETWELTAWPAVAPKEQPKPKGPGFWVRMRKLQRLPIWYVGAAAALAVAGGITILGTGLKTNQLEDDFQKTPTHATRDEGIRYRGATNAMVGITVTALVGAAVLALFTDWKNPFKKKERQVEVVPQLGTQGGGLAVSGSF